MASKISRQTKMAWSPVEMPLQRERWFMNQAIILNMGRELSNRMSKRPATTPGSLTAASTAASAPSGNSVSACRKSRTSPRAACAPAFIWRARPRGLASMRTRGKRAAVAAVASVLPPSTRMTSAAGKRFSRSGSSRARLVASSRAGITTLIRRRPGDGASRAPRSVVEAPVVVEVGEARFGERAQLSGQLGAGLGAEEGRHAARGREVAGEPLENRRHAGRLAVAAGPHTLSRVGEERDCLLVELGVEPRRIVRVGADLGARQRCAHDGEVHAWLLEYLPQDAVLDFIKGVRRAADRRDLLLPDRREQGAAVPYARGRILVEHCLDG